MYQAMTTERGSGHEPRAGTLLRADTDSTAERELREETGSDAGMELREERDFLFSFMRRAWICWQRRILLTVPG